MIVRQDGDEDLFDVEEEGRLAAGVACPRFDALWRPFV